MQFGVSNYCSHVFRFPNGYMSPNNKSQKKNASNQADYSQSNRPFCLSTASLFLSAISFE